MKYKIGDKVRKIKGYEFEGIIIGGGYKLDGERILYMVEMEKQITFSDFSSVPCVEMTLNQNGGGMVHIFAEEDIELIKYSL